MKVILNNSLHRYPISSAGSTCIWAATATNIFWLNPRMDRVKYGSHYKTLRRIHHTLPIPNVIELPASSVLHFFQFLLVFNDFISVFGTCVIWIKRNREITILDRCSAKRVMHTDTLYSYGNIYTTHIHNPTRTLAIYYGMLDTH